MLLSLFSLEDVLPKAPPWGTLSPADLRPLPFFFFLPGRPDALPLPTESSRRLFKPVADLSLPDCFRFLPPPFLSSGERLRLGLRPESAPEPRPLPLTLGPTSIRLTSLKPEGGLLTIFFLFLEGPALS